MLDEQRIKLYFHTDVTDGYYIMWRSFTFKNLVGFFKYILTSGLAESNCETERFKGGRGINEGGFRENVHKIEQKQ